MARGYMAGISGLRQRMVAPDPAHPQKARAVRRAFRKLLTSHKRKPVDKDLLTPGRKIWFVDKDKMWREIQVRSTEPYFVTCRRKKRRHPM